MPVPRLAAACARQQIERQHERSIPQYIECLRKISLETFVTIQYWNPNRRHVLQWFSHKATVVHLHRTCCPSRRFAVLPVWYVPSAEAARLPDPSLTGRKRQTATTTDTCPLRCLNIAEIINKRHCDCQRFNVTVDSAMPYCLSGTHARHPRCRIAESSATVF